MHPVRDRFECGEFCKITCKDEHCGESKKKEFYIFHYFEIIVIGRGVIDKEKLVMFD